MKNYYPNELKAHKVELCVFGIFYLLLEIMQVVKSVYFLWKGYSSDEIGDGQFSTSFLNDILYYQILGIILLPYIFVYLMFKKPQDYLSDFSKIGNLAIVSINQRRIINDKGEYDRGLLGD